MFFYYVIQSRLRKFRQEIRDIVCLTGKRQVRIEQDMKKIEESTAEDRKIRTENMRKLDDIRNYYLELFGTTRFLKTEFNRLTERLLSMKKEKAANNNNSGNNPRDISAVNTNNATDSKSIFEANMEAQ